MNTKLRVFLTHEAGDLLTRFQFEWASTDIELLNKFGDPLVNVGGSFLAAATLTPTISSGVFTHVTVNTPGAVGCYSTYNPPEVVVSDPGNLGATAAFSVTMGTGAGVGTITDIIVDTGGTGYSGSSTLTLSGAHTTVYPDQFVKLFNGFPYVRRINTMDAADPSLEIFSTLYVATIEQRVTAALASLRNVELNGQDLTKELVYQP